MTAFNVAYVHGRQKKNTANLALGVHWLIMSKVDGLEESPKACIARE